MELETGTLNLDDWIIDNGYVDDFNQFLKDVCNIDANVSIATVNDVFGKKNLLVEKHKNGLLPFSLVASGGMKAAELFCFWNKRFKEITFLCLDDFADTLHHTTALAIIKILKRYDSMQVVFTTRNTSLIDNDIMRPDCYMILSDGKLKSFADSSNG